MSCFSFIAFRYACYQGATQVAEHGSVYIAKSQGPRPVQVMS